MWLKLSDVKWAAAWQNQQNDMCTQQRLRSARASVQLSVSLLCTQWEATVRTQSFFMLTAKTLFRLVDAQADPSLCQVHRSFCWFCRAAFKWKKKNQNILSVTWLPLRKTNKKKLSNCPTEKSQYVFLQKSATGQFACLSPVNVWHRYMYMYSKYVWATSWENLFMPYAKNKGTDQPAHIRSLISAFVVQRRRSACAQPDQRFILFAAWMV